MKKVNILFAFLLSFHYVSASTCIDLSENIFRYQENDTVRIVQDFLYEKGYLKAIPNGYFGPGTFAAVKEYQTANGISATGVIGPLTRAALKSASCQTGTPSPQPTSPQKATSSSMLPSTPQPAASIPKSIVCT